LENLEEAAHKSEARRKSMTTSPEFGHDYGHDSPKKRAGHSREGELK
jgi:hypothetical protein